MVEPPEGFTLLEVSEIEEDGQKWRRGRIRRPDGVERWFNASLDITWDDIWAQLQIDAGTHPIQKFLAERKKDANA